MNETDRYVEWMSKVASEGVESASELNFAVDCSGGMASLIAEKLFQGARLLNHKLDGSFSCHSPNPLKSESRDQLCRAVLENRLDFGIIFDGDADRAMFVDERGEFVQPDYLIPVIARATIRALATKAEQPRVVHDVRTSRGAIETLTEMGCEPMMVPVGHAFAKPAMRRYGAICGGELAGHYYFSEFHCCDSGVLAALRVVGEFANAKRAGKSFSGMMEPIVTRYANSGEMNFRVDDKDAAIERVLNRIAEIFPREISRSTMDGVRIEFEDGWVNIRKSNTEPFLRLIVEAKEQGMLNEWVGKLKGAIENDQ